MDDAKEEIIAETVAVELNEKEKLLVQKLVQEFLNEDTTIFDDDDSIN
jgi:hypothetical protein